MSTNIVARTIVTFTLHAKKADGTVFSLTGCTVTFLLRKGTGATATYSATLNADPTTGYATYATAITDILTAGRWNRAWRIVKSGVDVTCPTVEFVVEESP